MRPIVVSLMLILGLGVAVSAQDRLPQEYVSADEIITLSADLSFEEAFQILSKVSFKKEGKIIVDPAKRQGRVDVDIKNLPWKKAFEVILKAHRLNYVEHEKFYEVVGEADQTQAGKVTISLASREVRIEAIFFEGDRHALAEAGIDWSFLRSGNTFTGNFGVNGATSVSSDLIEGNIDYSDNVNGIDYAVTGLLRTFENNNLGRILAQPEIVVVSGKAGRIQVGQDFSIKTRDFAGNVIDNFFSTGTILNVTPVVYTEDGIDFIHLAITAERSSAIPDVVSTTINKSQAQTEVILVNGECTAVGGLYSRDHKLVRKGFPILKDLPWWVFGLKYLFGYNLDETADKELIVVLRASLLPELRSRWASPRQPKGDTFEKNRSESQRGLDQTWDQGITIPDKPKP
ncbi:MAG: type II and III secretion system protein [bacterium]|nr:type II and III secretion system protein [bacterium]